MYRFNGLVMRAIEHGDLESLRQMHNASLEFLTDPTFVTPAMQEKWFESLGDGASRRYIVCEGEALVGFVRIDHWDLANRNACIGLDVMVEKRGQGYGKRCYELLLRHCWETWGLAMVWLWVSEDNKVALRLYDRLGFRQCGRLPAGLYRHGSYRDLILMALRRGEENQ